MCTKFHINRYLLHSCMVLFTMRIIFISCEYSCYLIGIWPIYHLSSSNIFDYLIQFYFIFRLLFCDYHDPTTAHLQRSCKQFSLPPINITRHIYWPAVIELKNIGDFLWRCVPRRDQTTPALFNVSYPHL